MRGLTSPTRDGAVFGLCTECRARTEDGCARCHRPLCADHRPPDGTRCTACEEGFSVRLAARRKYRKEFGPAFAGFSLTFGFFGSLAAILLGAGNIAILASLSAGPAIGLLVLALAPLGKGKVRARFLAETKEKGQLLGDEKAPLELGTG